MLSLAVNHDPERPEERLQALIDASPLALVEFGLDTRIRLWNPAAERIFGHARADALGETLDIIVPDKLRARHWDGYRRVMQTGRTEYAGRTLAVPALRRDGTRISVEFTVTLLREPAGVLRGIAAVLRDVTAEWEARRALQRRAGELERELEALRPYDRPHERDP